VTIRIPPESDKNTRDVFQDIEDRLRAIEERISVVAPPEADEPTGPVGDTEVSGDMYVEGSLDIGENLEVLGEVDAPHLYEGLIEPAPSGIPHIAQRVINMHGSLAIVPGSLSAGGVRCRTLDVPLHLSARLERTSSQTISHDTVTIVQWQTAIFDDATFWFPNTPTRLTIPTGHDGLYIIGTTLRFTNADFTGDRTVSQIKKNSTLMPGASSEIVNGGSGWPAMHVSIIDKAVAGDYYESEAYHDQGSDQTVDYRYSCFWIKRVH
jgi:hypothetical protein